MKQLPQFASSMRQLVISEGAPYFTASLLVSPFRKNFNTLDLPGLAGLGE
jgi:hypothetical protein